MNFRPTRSPPPRASGSLKVSGGGLATSAPSGLKRRDAYAKGKIQIKDVMISPRIAENVGFAGFWADSNQSAVFPILQSVFQGIGSENHNGVRPMEEALGKTISFSGKKLIGNLSTEGLPIVSVLWQVDRHIS